MLQSSDGAEVVSPGASLREVVLECRPRVAEGSTAFSNPRGITPTMVTSFIVELYGAPDDRRVGSEASPPQPVADDCDCSAAWPVIVVAEVTAYRRCDAEHAEIARVHALSDESLRCSVSCERR
jgi:hypothetical protein